jgi:hypothetical protein
MEYKKYILIFCFVILASIARSGTPVASYEFSSPTVSNNISFVFSSTSTAEAYTVPTTKADSACRHIPPSKYGYFNVNDATIPSTQNNLIVNITFFDESSTKINLQYNANDGNNYKTLSIQQSGSNSWITAKVAITNASFRNAQNNACDFRISGSGGDVYIRRISIEIGTLTPENEPIPSTTPSSYSEFIGKSVAGYQAWFVAGTLTSGWVHWNHKTSAAPGPGTMSFEVCPDVTEYPDEVLKPTNFALMGNGQPLKLFSSSSKEVIDVHYRWMREYGIDGAAVQRFIGNIGSAIINSEGSTIHKIRRAAEANERIFYICYDTSSSGMEETWDETIKMDWVYNVEQNNLTTSPAYAKVDNKPVVQLWGIGMKGGKNPGTAAETIALIDFFKARGCYVIGGTPRGWRTGTSDSKGVTQPATIPGDNENFLPVYESLNMISPWMPGRIRDNTSADNLFTSTMQPDKTYCDARGIQYMPVNFPGFSWSQWKDGDVNSAPRNAGEFMWRQATNIKKLGCQNMYFAMFDEYDEGTAIMKNATDWSNIPTNQYFLTSSADGIWCSSDFQLRVARAAVEMLKGTRTVTSTVPVAHSNGPVYYRNSFEKRTTPYFYLNDAYTKNGTFNLDPCFYQNAEVLRSNILSPVCEIQTTNTRSGLYSVKSTGTVGTTSAAKHIYKIANVKIAVKPNMTLSFWKKTENELGRFVFVDLRTKGNVYLKNGYTDQHGVSMNPAAGHGTVGGGWEKFTCEFGNGVLLGDTITEIYINYDGTGIGSYLAYFDDFLIEENANPNSVSTFSADNIFTLSQQGTSGILNLRMNESGNYLIQVYDISGVSLLNKKSNNTTETIDLSNCKSGVYILNITINNKKYYQKMVKM